MPRRAVREQTAVLRAEADHVADALIAERPLAAPRAARPCLVVLVGLPAAGKSHFARLLAESAGAVAVASDDLRRRLFVAPSYSADESRTVFEVARELARRLLTRGQVVILDATNLRERDRAPLYALAAGASAGLVIVRVVASERAIRERLGARAAGRSRLDASDADWSVHQMMRERYEPPARPYLTVDSEGDLAAELARVEEAVRIASA